MAITPLAGYMIDPNNPNGVVRIGSVPTPAPSQTPVSESTPASSGLTSYIPTQTADELAYENAIKAENDRLAGLAAPETEADRRTRITNQFQGEIDALNAVYATQKQQAIATGMGRLGSDAAVQARRGLIGSSFGAGQTSAVESVNNQDLQDVEAARGAALAAVYSKIRAAITESETDKKAAQATSAAANIAYLKSVPEKKNKIASDAIKALITANAEPTDKDLQDMAAQIGIDPSLMKQSYVAAVEDKKKELEKELAAQQKAELDRQKTMYESTAPKAVGDYTFEFDPATGEWKNTGSNKVVTPQTPGNLTTRQNIVLNSILGKSQKITTNNATFNVISDTSKRLLADPENPQTQLSMLYQYVKALDSNSAVREGETQLAQSTRSLYEKAQGLIQSIEGGSIVGSDAAVKMAKEAEALSKSWIAESKRQENDLRGQAMINGIEQEYVDTLDYINELNNGGQQSSSTPSTTKSGQPFDVAGAKAQGYTDEEIQAYLNSN